MKTAFGRGARHQRGIAVITAMLVVTIATVLAVEMAWQTNLDLRRTESLLSWDQAHEYAYGGEAFAARLLEEVVRVQPGKPAVYSRSDENEACAVGRSFSFDEAGSGMTGHICDLQARFNLNNLVSATGKHDDVVAKQFRRLLDAISELNEDIDIDPSTADVIVASAADWIDPDGLADYSGAEDDAYTSEQPPYRAANFWFTSISELRAIRGVTPEIYAAIAPYVAALPVTNEPRTRINVNTAEAPVLMSLGENISAENAAQWVSQSAEEPFTDAIPFTEFLDPAMAEYIGFASNFFELKGFVSIGTARLGMYSLLESDGETVNSRLRQFDVVEAVETPEPVTDEKTADDQ